jgi:hypothetical protein
MNDYQGDNFGSAKKPSILDRALRFLVATVKMPINIAAIAKASVITASRDTSINLPAPVVHVEAPIVNLPQPVINVAAPEVIVQPSFNPPNEWLGIAPNSEHALFKALSDAALSRTVAIIEAEMPSAMIFLEYEAFLKFSLAKADKKGAHCEFGVFSGGTINLCAAERPDITFDGFDSFYGLPSEWSGYLPFDFNRKGDPPEVRDNVRLHAGWFDDTLPGYSQSIDGVSFLHVDCDLYASTVTIFRILGDKLLPGCVIVFDEYFCYPGFEMHERKAFFEFLTDSGRRMKWIACCGQRAACILD